MATSKEAMNQQVVLMWGGGHNDGDYGEPIIARGLDGIRVKQVVCAAGELEHGFVQAYILTEEGCVFQWGPSYDWNAAQHKSRQISSGSLIEKLTIQIASGYNHFAAVTKEGDIYTWGRGAFGILGHGDEQNIERPKLVEALDGIHIVQVACAAAATVALSQDGKVYTFGSNMHGCNGNGRTVGNQLLPARIEALPPIGSVSACYFHVATVCRQGHVYTWGEGLNGQLGHESQLSRSTPQAIESLSQESIVQVSCGVWHTAGLTSDGNVYSFGCGAKGHLGHGDEDKQTAPKLVESLVGTEISKVSCGFQHTCFLSHTGHLYVCGSGKHGHGSNKDVLSPRRIQSFEKYNVTDVCSFGRCTVALATWKTTTLDVMPISISFGNMVNNEEFADVVFRTDEGQVFAHKSILAQRSEFFRAMITSGMKESSSHVIQLSNITKPTLLLVLEYLYTGHVVVPVTAVLDLYCAADMYGLEFLKYTCLESLSEHLTVDNAAQLLLEASKTSAEELTNTCFKYVVEHIQAVSKTADMDQYDSALVLKILRSVVDN